MIAAPKGFTERLRLPGAMHTLGRLLQHLGLIVPVLAVGLELAHAIDARGMLGFLLLAVCLFWIGRLIEGYFGPQG